MDIDDSDFGCLGIPTPLEMWKQQSVLLATEIEEHQADLRRCRANIASLVAINSQVSAERDSAKHQLSCTARLLSDTYRELSMVKNQLYTYKGMAARHVSLDDPEANQA